tara:strand:- start:94 stop:270 length:177 start_codon:yes stop_codon:yes gene_type:complete
MSKKLAFINKNLHASMFTEIFDRPGSDYEEDFDEYGLNGSGSDYEYKDIFDKNGQCIV